MHSRDIDSCAFSLLAGTRPSMAVVVCAKQYFEYEQKGRAQHERLDTHQRPVPPGEEGCAAQVLGKNNCCHMDQTADLAYTTIACSIPVPIPFQKLLESAEGKRVVPRRVCLPANSGQTPN